VTAFVQDMGVDHRRADVFVAKKLLNGTNIIAGLKQMRGKGVTEGGHPACLTTSALRTASLTAR